MRASGASDKWFGKADKAIRELVGGSNGLLFEQLIKASGHADVECANLLRHGAKIIGELDVSGIGTPCETNGSKPTVSNSLWSKHVSNNVALCQRLMTEREDDGQEIWRKESLIHDATLDDAMRWRQSLPIPIDSACAEGYLLQPRFTVEQVGLTRACIFLIFTWSAGARRW